MAVAFITVMRGNLKLNSRVRLSIGPYWHTEETG